jgi:hypothetical protein
MAAGDMNVGVTPYSGFLHRCCSHPKLALVFRIEAGFEGNMDFD